MDIVASCPFKLLEVGLVFNEQLWVIHFATDMVLMSYAGSIQYLPVWTEGGDSNRDFLNEPLQFQFTLAPLTKSKYRPVGATESQVGRKIIGFHPVFQRSLLHRNFLPFVS